MTWYGQRLQGRICSALTAGVVAVTMVVMASGAASASTASPFTSVTPVRILDTRSGSGPLAASGTQSVQVAGVGGVPSTGVAAVVVNLTVTEPTSNGWIAAYPDQTRLPNISNLNFTKGQTDANLAVVPVGSDGRIALHNGSPGTVQLLADVSGYFLSGASFSQGAFSAVAPSRLLDTRSGLGAPKATVAAGASLAMQIAGVGEIPASGVSAVVVNLTVTNPAGPGWVNAYPDLTSAPNASNLNFTAGETIPNLAVVPVGTDGKIDLTNHSGGPIDLLADVFGYFVGSSPSATGAFGAVTPSRVLDTRAGNGAIRAQVPTHGEVAVKVAGTANVPASGVSAVVVNITATAPAAGGWVAGYPDETTQPNVSNLNFAAGETRPNLSVVPVGADGRITLFNGSYGTVQLIVDISGYFLGSAASATSTAAPSPPLISTSRYLRKLTGSSGDAGMMANYGAADAAANPSGHPYLMLLDIGGQDATRGGVILSASNPPQFISYAQLVSAVNSYVDGYATRRGADAPATILIGVNNDIDVSSTTGADWATKVIAPIARHAASRSGITIGGADDMEPGFSATPAATRSWLSGYLAATANLPFVFNGSADGCSWTAANSSCNHGWTAADLKWLAGGAAPSRILALPQIYNQTMAAQWRYISLTGASSPLAFGGALTEYTACQQAGGCGSLTGNEAWNTFWSQLQSDSRVSQADLPYSTDLMIS